MVTWEQFITVVEAKFSVDDHRSFMSAIIALKQKGTMAEYCGEFQELMFKLCSHNPYYDETMFVSHFLRGLKQDIRTAVAAQLPEIVDRAILLTHVKADLASKSKTWSTKPTFGGQARTDTHKPATRTVQGDFWKERQLKEYRRANGLCFSCGDKYDPTHSCASKS